MYHNNATDEVLDMFRKRFNDNVKYWNRGKHKEIVGVYDDQFRPVESDVSLLRKWEDERGDNGGVVLNNRESARMAEGGLRGTGDISGAVDNGQGAGVTELNLGINPFQAIKTLDDFKKKDRHL